MHLALTTAKGGTLGAMAQTLYLLDPSSSTRSDSDPVLVVSPNLMDALTYHWP